MFKHFPEKILIGNLQFCLLVLVHPIIHQKAYVLKLLTICSQQTIKLFEYELFQVYIDAKRCFCYSPAPLLDPADRVAQAGLLHPAPFPPFYPPCLSILLKDPVGQAVQVVLKTHDHLWGQEIQSQGCPKQRNGH